MYATTELQNQVKKGYYGTGYNGTVGDDASLAFSTGKVPMYLSGSWSFGGFLTSIKDFQWDIFLMPGKKFVTGRRRELLASTFDTGPQVQVLTRDGRDLISTRSEAGRDELEGVPLRAANHAVGAEEGGNQV